MAALTGLIVVILLVIALLGAIALIYYSIYKRRINRALEEGRSMAHNGMAEPQSVSRSLLVFGAVIAILALLGSMANLRSRLQSIEHSLRESNAQLQDMMMMQGEELTRLIDQSTSNILRAQISVESVDQKAKTVDYRVTVVPKVIADDTKISVQVEMWSAKLARVENEFIGTITLPLFGSYGTADVMITHNGETVVEESEALYFGSVYMVALPVLDSFVNNDVTSRKKDQLKVSFDVNFLPVKSSSLTAKIVSGALVACIDGKEVDREDISGKLATLPLAQDLHYEKNFAYKAGERFELLLKYTDENGLQYTIRPYACVFGKDSSWGEYSSKEFGSGDITICDTDGSFLYSEKTEQGYDEY